MKYHIKSRLDGKVLYESEAMSFRLFLEAAAKNKVNMSRTDMFGVNCPICEFVGTATIEVWEDSTEGERYELKACQSCNVVFAFPFQFPGRDWYEKFNYVEGYSEAAGGTGADRFEWLLDRLPLESGKILDVGCAAGQFLKLAARRGLEPEGLEMDRRFVEAARIAGATAVQEGCLDETFAAAHREEYEAISLLDVLEHQDDPVAMIKCARTVLKPGGFILISVPNNLRPIPFGRDAWDYPPHHLTRWTPLAMQVFLERFGFGIFAMDAGRLPVWEFSRIWADRSARVILKALKLLLFGRGAAESPMSDLLGESGAAPPARAVPMPGKCVRIRLVALYHAVFHCATYPIFLLVKLYYLWRTPGVGVSILVVAKKM